MNHVRDLFRIYRVLLSSSFRFSGFLFFILVRTSKARSFEATIRVLLFKTRATPKLQRSLGSFDEIKETH
jgi:hypothetical protein